MTIEMLLVAVRRHWSVVLVVLVLTLVAIATVPGQIDSDFEMSGNVILLSPPTVLDSGGDDVQVNPWSRFGSAESGAAAALVEVLRRSDIERVVTADETVSSYDIGINRANGAIIDIVIRASAGASAVEAFDKTVMMLGEELEGRQSDSGAAQSTWLRAEILTRPGQAEELPGSKTRAMVAIGVLGTLSAISAALVLDAIVTSRRRKDDDGVSTDVRRLQDDDPRTDVPILGKRHG